VSRRVPITKMHGTLNDFVILDNRSAKIADLVDFGRFVCDRRSALGADGLLAIEASSVADARMRVINADGSEAEMCGNGMRCVARYLTEAGEGDRLRVETMAGIIEADVLRGDPAFEVRLDVGTPELDRRTFEGRDVWFVCVGNPHLVAFVASLDEIDLVAFAERVQADRAYAGGVNVHLAVETASGLDVKHWERGVGLTMACGTGTVACATAAIVTGRAKSPVAVDVPGGRLTIGWDGSGTATLTGPAVRVFDGDVVYDETRVRA
jgi:diaminopimelate epimerase